LGHEFEVRKEIELAATPEQVWQAIATGPGIDAWFMGHNQVEPGAGGTVRMTVGDQTDQATITGWEPRERLAVRSGPGEDGSFMAFEYLIEGRQGGTTVLRLVHSGVLGGDWETEYDALRSGWDMYLHTLAEYLAWFPGQTATVVTVFRPQAADQERAWAVLARELGLSGTVAKDQPARLPVAGPAQVDGVVDYADPPSFLGVRTGDGLYRFIHSGPKRGDVVAIGHHVFADVDRQQAEQAWQGWLDRLFA
jgi:uncharacterized protein YndB with AHSA1/START domain